MPTRKSRSKPARWMVAVAAVACAGADDKDEEELPPLEEHACLNVAVGEIIDVALDRADARTITVGREPYRVNLYPGEAGYLRFETAAAQDLVLVIDHAGAVPAVWRGEDREALEPGAPNTFCEADLPEVLEFSVPAGEHWLEAGPAFQGNVWMMLAER